MLISRRATWHMVLVAMTVAAWAVANTTEAANKLQWKFKEGDSTNYAMSRHEDININAGGVELQIEIKQVLDMTWTVKSVASDGTAEVTQTVDRLQLKLVTPFTGEFVYDSKSEEKPEGQVWDFIGKPIEAMIGQSFTLKISPSGKVSDVQLPESLVKQFAEQAEGGGDGGGGARMMMMGGGFGEEQIREMISRSVVPLPTDGGAAWTQIVESKLGPLGVQKTETSYIQEGTEELDGKKLDKITTKTSITIVAAEGDNAAEGGLALELTEQEGAGTVLFDSAKGRQIKATEKQKVVMEGDFMGNEFIQERETNLITIEGTSDKLPQDEPAAEPAAAPADGAESENK